MLSSHFQKRILENLSTAVFLINHKFEIIYSNPAAGMLLQASQKRILSTRFNELFVRFDEKLMNELSAILESGHTYTQRECEFELYTGHSILTDCTVASSTLEGEDYLIIEMQSKDRLTRISREEQLQENQETAEILIRGLAHEIKNPLGGIRGAAQLLDAELTVPDQHEYTQIIMDESDRLRNLVDRMLGSHKALNRARLNIHEILERVCSLIHAESGGQVKIIKDYDPSIPDLEGDKSQLIQAFLNIVKNALQALSEITEPEKQASKHTEQPSITIRTRTLRQFTIGQNRYKLVAKIEVIDNGPGIPPGFIQNIFYPMISGRANGTGLGLSITQSILTKHDGLVECESKPGKTNFIVYLPLEPKHAH